MQDIGYSRFDEPSYEEEFVPAVEILTLRAEALDIQISLLELAEKMKYHCDEIKRLMNQ